MLFWTVFWLAFWIIGAIFSGFFFTLVCDPGTPDDYDCILGTLVWPIFFVIALVFLLVGLLHKIHFSMEWAKHYSPIYYGFHIATKYKEKKSEKSQKTT